jgi:hypothetical protein
LFPTYFIHLNICGELFFKYDQCEATILPEYFCLLQ